MHWRRILLGCLRHLVDEIVVLVTCGRKQSFLIPEILCKKLILKLLVFYINISGKTCLKSMESHNFILSVKLMGFSYLSWKLFILYSS